MQTTSLDFLARLLGHLRDRLGAEVLEARDDLDGSIVVDVRVDADRAVRGYRVIIHERAATMFERSRELKVQSRALSARTNALLVNLRAENTSRRQQLLESRRGLREIRGLRRSNTTLIASGGGSSATWPGAGGG